MIQKDQMKIKRLKNKLLLFQLRKFAKGHKIKLKNIKRAKLLQRIYKLINYIFKNFKKSL